MKNPNEAFLTSPAHPELRFIPRLLAASNGVPHRMKVGTMVGMFIRVIDTCSAEHALGPSANVLMREFLHLGYARQTIKSTIFRVTKRYRFLVSTFLHALTET